MKKLKVFKELNTELARTPSRNFDHKKLSDAFERILKELDIKKEVRITDNLYLQPFKLEYVNVSDGLKDYFVGLDEQREARAEEYCKLVMKKNKKLVAIKSFGKVSKLDNDTFDMLLLLIRLTQYTLKNRELFSLEISILDILKH